MDVYTHLYIYVDVSLAYYSWNIKDYFLLPYFFFCVHTFFPVFWEYKIREKCNKLDFSTHFNFVKDLIHEFRLEFAEKTTRK